MTLLQTMKFPGTPCLQLEPNILIKHEGLGPNFAHKYRSFAWLFENETRAGRKIAKITDRSSGSWAMAGAQIAAAKGLTSTWITVGEPHPYVRRIVEANGGKFLTVYRNQDRISTLQRLEHDGFWSPDQHRNSKVIDAFAETLGVELTNDLRRLGIGDGDLAFVVGAVGTGGTVAGVSRKLRENGWNSFRAIGVDSSISIASGEPSFKAAIPLTVPGVGSKDEVCQTFRAARKEIGTIIRSTPLEAAEELIRFSRIVPRGCGMSSGLVLSAIRRTILPQCPAGKIILAIFPDDAARYSNEINVTLKLRPDLRHSKP